MRRLALASLLLTCFGCFKASDDPNADEATSDVASETAEASCPIGSEACPCTVGGSCDNGLVCLSNVCVDNSAESSSSSESTTQAETTTDTTTDSTDSTDTGDPPVACDPLLQDCRMVSDACYWLGDLFGCIDVGNFPTGSPCVEINDCSPGNICVDAANLPVCNGASCCASFCDLTDPVCLVMGVECVSFFEEGMAPPGYEDVGVCVVPF